MVRMRISIDIEVVPSVPSNPAGSLIDKLGPALIALLPAFLMSRPSSGVAAPVPFDERGCECPSYERAADLHDAVVRNVRRSYDAAKSTPENVPEYLRVAPGESFESWRARVVGAVRL